MKTTRTLLITALAGTAGFVAAMNSCFRGTALRSKPNAQGNWVVVASLRTTLSIRDVRKALNNYADAHGHYRFTFVTIERL